jgi:hypothetical protein
VLAVGAGRWEQMGGRCALALGQAVLVAAVTMSHCVPEGSCIVTWAATCT